MRKLVFHMLVSLDGYFVSSNKELDWHTLDSEFNQFAVDLLKSTDTLLFGRVTYETMAAYWPTQLAIEDDPIVAERMTSLSKVVFSRTLKESPWPNTRFVSGPPAAEVRRLKEMQGKTMVIMGSSDLAAALLPERLIDELLIFINPIVLGSGKPLFDGIRERYRFKLSSVRSFPAGSVLHRYLPA